MGSPLAQQPIRRDYATRFQPGHKPTSPGRPQGYGGRRRALAVLDAMLADTGNLEKLGEAMQEEFDRDPMKFFRKIVMPLLPQGIMLTTNGENSGVTWRSLLTTFPTAETTPPGPIIDAETKDAPAGAEQVTRSPEAGQFSKRVLRPRKGEGGSDEREAV